MKSEAVWIKRQNIRSPEGGPGACEKEEDMRIYRLDENTKKDLLENLLKRSPNHYGSYQDAVNGIVNDIKEKGDDALYAYTKKSDGADVSSSNIRVTGEEIEEAFAQVGQELVGVMTRARDNIRSYHEKQMQYSWFDSRPDGSILGQKVTPIASVGVYVPGGKAPRWRWCQRM